jgi:hypothetical protein
MSINLYSRLKEYLNITGNSLNTYLAKIDAEHNAGINSDKLPPGLNISLLAIIIRLWIILLIALDQYY